MQDGYFDRQAGIRIRAVKKLGEEIGYGELMSLASSLWREKLRETGTPETGAFVPVIPELNMTVEEIRKQCEKDDQYVKMFKSA